MIRIPTAAAAAVGLVAIAMGGPVSAQDCTTRLAELEGRMTKLDPSSEQRQNLQELIEAARVFEWLDRKQGCLVTLSEAEGMLEPAEAAVDEEIERQEEAAADVAEGELESMPAGEPPQASGLEEDPAAQPPAPESEPQPEAEEQPQDEQAALSEPPAAPETENGSPAQDASPEPDPGPLGEVPAEELIGREVQDAEGEAVAEMVNLVRQSSDRAMFAVVRVGGFLGLGGKEVAVPLADLQPGEGEELRLANRTRDQLEQLPPYNPAQYGEAGQ